MRWIFQEKIATLNQNIITKKQVFKKVVVFCVMVTIWLYVPHVKKQNGIYSALRREIKVSIHHQLILTTRRSHKLLNAQIVWTKENDLSFPLWKCLPIHEWSYLWIQNKLLMDQLSVVVFSGGYYTFKILKFHVGHQTSLFSDIVSVLQRTTTWNLIFELVTYLSCFLPGTTEL